MQVDPEIKIFVEMGLHNMYFRPQKEEKDVAMDTKEKEKDNQTEEREKEDRNTEDAQEKKRAEIWRFTAGYFFKSRVENTTR